MYFWVNSICFVSYSKSEDMEEKLQRVSTADIRFVSVENVELTELVHLDEAVKFLLANNRFSDVVGSCSKQTLAASVKAISTMKSSPEVIGALGCAQQMLYESQNWKYGVLPFVDDNFLDCVHNFW